MAIKEREKRKNTPEEEHLVRVKDSMVYDRLHVLSAEYSVSVELLVNAAIKRLLDDVDFVRGLRTGKMGTE